MKDIFITILGLLFCVVVLIGLGYIAIVLGMQVPYHLWTNGHWGFSIAQAVIVWSWLLGGNKK